MEILHSATTFVRRSKVAESWAVENRWMWQGIERMRESENSASSVNLAIKSHRSQLLWKSQWNYSRERQLLLHYQLLPLPPLHLYMPHLLYCYFPGSELEQGSPVLWQPVPPVHKESATNELLFRAKKKKIRNWHKECARHGWTTASDRKSKGIFPDFSPAYPDYAPLIAVRGINYA